MESACRVASLRCLSSGRSSPARPGTNQPAAAGATAVESRGGSASQEVLTIADALHERGIAVQIRTGKPAGSYSPAREGKLLTALTTRPGSLAASVLATAASASALEPASEIRLATRSA